VYDRLYRPVARYDRPYIDNTIFLDFLEGIWSKRIWYFLWKRIKMDLSHESTKNFDPLLIVRDPYTQQQNRKKKNYRVALFRTPSSSLFNSFSLFALWADTIRGRENLTCRWTWFKQLILSNLVFTKYQNKD
jgi:hypothetical protein